MASENSFPPSYSAATGQHSSIGKDMNFVDFLPQCTKPGGLIKRPIYEPFNVLIDRANEWLKQSPNWEAKTCESVEFKCTYNDINYERMNFIDYGKHSTYYIRALRLWIVPRSDPSRPPQQIGYINVVPLELPNSGVETLDLVLDRFNKHLLSCPIPGRVLTFETQEMKVPGLREFDPDTSLWIENAGFALRFVFIFRVFYEVGEPANEVVGIASFVPKALKEIKLFSIPEFEPFSSVINNAFHWCSQQSGIRFCNAQSLELKLKRDLSIDTQQMIYTEYSVAHYIRILRLAYTMSVPNSVGYMPSNAPVLNLTCKTFMPEQTVMHTLQGPEFESLSQTRQRVVAWVKATGARVVSAETCVIRIYGFFGAGPEASFVYSSSSEHATHWMFVIRLYLDGFYPEPPPEVLPPLPVVQKGSSCDIL